MADNPMITKPTLVLTRPQAASERVARALGVANEAVISPIIRIEPTGEEAALADGEAVIITSFNALSFVPDIAGRDAYVVGERSASEVKARGGRVRFVAQDVSQLVHELETNRLNSDAFMHIRGRHTRGGIAERLLNARDVVVYDQVSQPLDDMARGVLTGNAHVVLPLYSPRSAAILAHEIGGASGPNVQTLAISEAVAEVWQRETGGRAAVCSVPSGKEMLKQLSVMLGGRL